MQFSTRQLFMAIGALAVFCAVVRFGYSRLGTHGGVMFGLFFGIAIVCCYAGVSQLNNWSIREHIYNFIALIISVSAGLYVINHNWEMYADIADHQRQAVTLQTKLRNDKRFHNMLLWYEDLNRDGGGWEVSGSVKSGDDSAALREAIESSIGKHFDWNVSIDTTNQD